MSISRHSWLRLRLAVLSLGLVGGLVGYTPAARADAFFSVGSVETRLSDGVYLLDANIDYRFSGSLSDALHNGVDLVIETELEVVRERNWWGDETIASLIQRYRIGFYALSRLYVVQNLNTGVQTSFTTLSGALFSIGNVRGFPLIDASLLEDGRVYEAALRTRLAVDELPLPLRIRGYMSDEWRPASDWYRWSLP